MVYIKKSNKLEISVIKENEVLERWDAIISLFPWNNMYQSYAWGEVKRQGGWIPIRLVMGKKGDIVSAAQVFTKKKWGCVAAWIPGGPLFYEGREDNTCVYSSLRAFCSSMAKVTYIRIYPMIPETLENSEVLKKCGWHLPVKPFHKSLTILVDLTGELSSLRNRFKGKWRYYLKQSEKVGHDFRRGVKKEDFFTFVDAHSQMCERKGVDQHFSLKDLMDLKNSFKDDLLLFLTFTNDSLTSGWLMVRQANTAYVLRAVTTIKGRQLFASYYCMYRAFVYLAELGVKNVEMGGIDPEGNPGVTHFKRGVGGEEIKWLGEWEWANLSVMKMIINRYI